MWYITVKIIKLQLPYRNTVEVTVKMYFMCENHGRQMCKSALSEGYNARVRAQPTHFMFFFFFFFSQEEGGGAFVMQTFGAFPCFVCSVDHMLTYLG